MCFGAQGPVVTSLKLPACWCVELGRGGGLLQGDAGLPNIELLPFGRLGAAAHQYPGLDFLVDAK